MSTRANIIIKDQDSKLVFYRHSDGYPDETLPTLLEFLGWLKDGRIRDNVSQAAGWLIIIGATEYGTVSEPTEGPLMGWKVGAYEPTTSIHGDINYLYIIDLKAQTIEVQEVDYSTTPPTYITIDSIC